MTIEEVKQAYIDKFGGYPAFLLMGAADEEIIAQLSKCLKEGKELEPESEDATY